MKKKNIMILIDLIEYIICYDWKMINYILLNAILFSYFIFTFLWVDLILNQIILAETFSKHYTTSCLLSTKLLSSLLPRTNNPPFICSIRFLGSAVLLLFPRINNQRYRLLAVKWLNINIICLGSMNDSLHPKDSIMHIDLIELYFKPLLNLN